MRSAMSYIEAGFKNWFGFTKDISTIQQYLAFISCFGSCESTKSEMKESILKLVIDSYNVLSDSKSSNTTLKYFSLMLVSWVAEYNCSQYKECSSVSSNGIIAKNHKSFVENMVKEQRINTVFQGEESKPCYDSKMLSSCVLAGWKLLHSYLEAFDSSVTQIKSLIQIDQLIDVGLEATQIGGKDVLAEVNRVFGVLLPEYINELETETLSKFICTTWKACFELRKNELFWIIFKSWIKMFYQNRLLKDEKCNTLQIEYANNILELGETVGGLSNCLFKHLNEEIDTPEALNKLPNDLLVKALVFGPVHRKDLRIESEVCNFIKSKDGDYSINILKPLTGDRDDCEVRLYVLNMILNVCSGKNGEITSPRTLISVMESLIEEDSRISEKKKRYYGDSHHHRVKNRIVQVLLVLEHVLFKSESSSSSEVFYEKLLDWLSDNLSRESHQPSIRYQLQWLFVRCLLHKPSHLPKFWIMFEKGSEERAGCVCSYISIAYHLAAVLKDDEFSSRCVQEILPWCMAQHFNVRMYAQFVLSKLWSINEASGWGEEHRVVRTSLVRSLSKGSAIKNLPKLECDFYFSNFHPMKHFSLKSIFIELPRLSSVTRDEWCSEMVLENCLHSSRDLIDLDDPITVSDAIKSLADCEPATWTFKTRESAECASETDIIQKKFVPWRDMLADEESNIPSDQKREREGLIVVASLIDRPPNLGGLSRTCEVFGVSELVLNSLHYLTDKQFTSLSMSSEKHVNITEVKEYHMADYIQKMKRAGFTIVGAEQTPASVQLTQFKFPCNTVLILGNEKEGIPANMLPLLDACIVVPHSVYFIELPRLSSVTRDEWCSEMVLENCLHSSRDLIDLDDPITASDAIKSLADCEPATWTFKTRESAECASETDIIQKKFVPWRDMLADEESNIPSDQKREREGLIVVASLIDRPPNLGGLSRTCEVFGVSELVLNSLHYLTDKQFTSLSMSSEKHVNITEVKEYHMADYIQKMKRAGFTIVGAEQTPASVQLTQFKFPCNTVLILGNEKEGIPANMLPLLDACIVVPQYGLVRSLNVHVTGALFIWEYAKQYK
ncbi:probable methyltransferase TARBP1 [Nilaparvata lugens]|uniref:probable methyltransferase TARBP1 n=1 Tax=Nilaparvata lugens TaxID=108931 RepID=UPI00193D7C49|nr:probable methyltransferase TARBP1 [Nilaparvata lugens]